MIKDFIIFSVEGMKKRQLRSILTMIGIFIGIAAVVSLISLGQGLNTAISDQFEKMGGDKIIIMPGSGEAFGTFSTEKLTQKDLDVVRKTNGILDATEMLYSTKKIKFNDESLNTFIIGLPTDESSKIVTDMEGFKVEKGRNLKDGDAAKIIVGWRLWNDDFFDKSVNLRDKLEINGQSFEVIGLMKRIGNPQDDSQVYVSIEEARELFAQPDEINFIYAQVKKGYLPEDVAEDVKKELRDSRNEKEGEESFSVQTFENILNTFNSIFSIVQAVLIGIAAISLLVGGIGIMNTMYMSVMERTKEIGVMKAIGAKNSHILQIFLIESGIYGLIGGTIGIIIGIGIAKLVEIIAFNYLGSDLLKAQISISLISLALAFSFVVGALSGIAPAYRASRMNPVEALRYE